MAMPKRPGPREEEERLIEPTQPSSRTYDANIDTHPDRDYDEAKEALLSKHRSQCPDTYNDDTDGALAEEPGTSWKLKSSPGAKIQRRKRTRRMIFGVALFLIFMILAAIWGRPLLLPAPHTLQSQEEVALQNDSNAIISNGTHQYQKTVLLVSIDGLRASYLDWGLTPHLLHISKRGLRARYMKPSFPTITFPNHWTLLTGLYPESHGIIANNFWDPVTKSEFHYSSPEQSWNGTWWGGEAVWETAGKNGLITANLMWPGPPVTVNGVSHAYFVPFKDKYPLDVKVQQIVDWLELPFEARPRLLTVYEPSLDEAGHLAGPDSELVRVTLKAVDEFARQVHDAITQRNLTHIVDVIFVSDHGMTDTSKVQPVYLDDILGDDGVNAIEHEDSWPLIGLRFKAGTNSTKYLELLEAAASKQPGFGVYTHETMPKRWHFAQTPRIAPIYVVPHIGWAIINRHKHEVEMRGTYSPKGNHGYDNDEPEMRAMFVADGPFATKAKRRALESTPRWRRALHHIAPRIVLPKVTGWLDTRIIDPFPNIELNGLVLTILGLQDSAPENNGTVGFWDKYM